MIAAKPEIRALGASVGLSLLGHAAGAAALIWLAAQMPPAPIRIAMPERTVDVVFEPPRPAPPVPDAIPLPAEPPVPEPPAVTAEPGPPPASKAVSEAPPPPVVETPPLPQPRKPPPVVRPKPAPLPKPAARKPPPSPPRLMARKPAELPPEPRTIQPRTIQPRTLQPPAPLPASPASPVPAYPSQQTAALPPVPHPALPPSPAPVVSGAYRGMLSTWLESHKRYPEAARFRGEQGRVGLSFRVARSGQVLNFSITSSSGYAELDAAVEAMMRGAVLPPFPPEMTANDIQVNVTIRFGLDR